jgi:hypothetical protein
VPTEKAHLPYCSVQGCLQLACHAISRVHHAPET